MKGEELNITLVTTEIVPFSKVGGLADVMGALPDELEKLDCNVSVFTPLYSSIDRKAFNVRAVRGLSKLEVPVSGKKVRFRIRSALKPGTGITVYFVDSDRFYAREGIYTVPDTGAAYEDEDERTIFFNRAVVAAMKALDLHPDVVHCNDFHAGLIPAYLSLEDSGTSRFHHTGTVLSIHNMAYQGNFPQNFMTKAGFDPSLFTPMSPFEFWGKVNVMKIGISFAGIISTVSKTYADEIATSEEFGYGLEGVLRARREDLIGILNGIDQNVWDPSTDDLIPFPYDAENLAGKKRCRAALLKAYKLPADTKNPLIGMVSRLVDQKGFDILAKAFDSLMKLGVKIVILGTGQEKYHELYTKLAAAYPKQLGLKLEFNNRLAHEIEAGSDFFLMPSRYEPCGLNQMYSLRYGTVPIVRATGGLKDTITDLNRTGSKGNGFTFKAYNSRSLIAVVKKAVTFYGNKAVMDDVRGRIMREDHSWLKSAKEYRALYERAMRRIGLELTR